MHPYIGRTPVTAGVAFLTAFSLLSVNVMTLIDCVGCVSLEMYSMRMVGIVYQAQTAFKLRLY